MLIEDVADRIDQCLAARPYYPCVLLIHADMRVLQDAAEQLVERKAWRALAVGRVLTESLALQPQALYSTLASTALDRPLAALRPGPVLCTDLALLFEPLLALDPLALLRQWSRRVPIVAAWPGAHTGTGLAYAVPSHAHYRMWRSTGLDAGSIVPL